MRRIDHILPNMKVKGVNLYLDPFFSVTLPCCPDHSGAMPRQVRIQYPGAMNHVMNRGNRRQAIYLDDVDRQDFLKTLAEACQKTGWQIPCKLAIALRLRQETTLSVKQIAKAAPAQGWLEI